MNTPVLPSSPDGIVTARNSVALVGAGAFAVYYGRMVVHPEANLWDAAIPNLTDAVILALFGLTWWTAFLVPRCQRLGRAEVLLRYGSPAGAVGRSSVEMMRELVVGGAMLAVTSVVISVPLGLSIGWSRAAASANVVEASAYSAASVSLHFASPLIAVVLCLAYTAVFYVVLGLIAVTLAALGSVRASFVFLVAILLWTVLCSFSRWPLPTVLDTSQAMSLPWALFNNGLPVVITVEAAAVLLCGLALHITHARLSLAQLMARRAAMGAVGALLVGVASLDSLNRRGAGEIARSFFSGQHGDLLHYVVVALVPLGYGTYLAAVTAERMEGFVDYELLRFGGPRRWLLVRIRSVLLDVTVGTLAIGVLLFLVEFLVRGTLAAPSDALVLGGAGLWAEGMFVSLVVLALTWTGSALQRVWPVVAGSMLVLGYPVAVDLGRLNVFAPYSIPDTAMGPASAGAFTVAFLIAIVLVLGFALVVSAVPRMTSVLVEMR